MTRNWICSMCGRPVRSLNELGEHLQLRHPVGYAHRFEINLDVMKVAVKSLDDLIDGETSESDPEFAAVLIPIRDFLERCIKMGSVLKGGA